MIWREKRILLLTLGGLLLANVVFFLTYRVQYQSRIDEMSDRLAQAEGQLAQSRRARAVAEQSIDAYRRVDRDAQRVFDEQWSTTPRRLTLFISEVKRLAEASNAVPGSISFNQTDAKIARGTGGAATRRSGEGLGAREVGITFSVEATYDQVRRLINLLELSDQFVIIDQISLAHAAESKLSFSLSLKTLFRDDSLLPQQRGANKRL